MIGKTAESLHVLPMNLHSHPACCEPIDYDKDRSFSVVHIPLCKLSD